MKKSKKAAKKVKKVVKKSAKKSAVKKSKATRAAKPIGAVTHFYNQIKVAIVKFKKPVKTGSMLKFFGATTDFSQKIVSMQFNHKPVAVAKKGQQIGIKVSKRVREGDGVFEGK